MKPAAALKAQALRAMELNCHYGTLKGLQGADPMGALCFLSGTDYGGRDYARKFWAGVFMDFPELVKTFPNYARQFLTAAQLGLSE